MQKLFGTSGVRGLVVEEITPELAMGLGLAMATQLGNSGPVVVGKDPRTSGDMLESSVISGLLSGGCNVTRLGMVPTPAVAFAVQHLKAKAGVMITASHNPAEYNGFKLWDSGGMAYTPKLEGQIERIYFQNKGKRVDWGSIGKIGKADVTAAYISAIASAVKLSKEFKVVVDCGNGAASAITPVLLRRLGCKVTTLNCHPDGHFPGRGLEPTEENLMELGKVVKSVGADIGIAHDGDADRVAAVDDKGRFVPLDKLLALISAFQVRKGGVVVTTVDASGVVDEAVKNKGGKVIRTKVGDVNVAEAVKKRRAVFGGEPCGAWIFPDFQLAPDGPLGAAKVLELLSNSGSSMSELADSIPERYTVREKFKCPNERKATAMKKLGPALKRALKATKVLSIDGVRVEIKDGWVLVRPSGTEPYIRVTAEGKTQKRAKELLEKALKVVKVSSRA
jgi:phosphoglucosamine mutase